ncbi:hypothetical protein CPJ18_03505 [Agrobacterium rosae]|uniref:Uncharacterized protein n=1 Tax=Agrobacterium rosae TaxID=1972867 RepID=A0AAE5S0M5_9HYPH|nr:hypothetical protein [Agrobacterium rosae]KAA3512999.1 hypothetical protein DXM21_08265 [Agrobacterium rosae]KAA3521514.1 hypothetical protein DXM25_09715 [Agrobacterium rosae]MCM2432615.1 hypothetical protein [Agrobacterium rosae]MDX8328314.1 hypothetical protein [Agrobacterium rosae]MQB48430.1 hypothetical protein [Agrobacterium rosae]
MKNRYIVILTATVASIVVARENLLDRVMGPGRRRKSSEKLRAGPRFLALELKKGWLDGAAGMLVASGRKFS